MPGFNFAPAWSLLTAFRAAPLRPFPTFGRLPDEARRWSQPAPYRPVVERALAAVRARGAGAEASLLRQRGGGRLPTVVLGGLVPDASEQVYLLRRYLLKSGDVYYLNYPREGFSLDVVCAQLTDLTAELAAAGQPPVIFGVSFGAGVVLEWLRRARAAGDEPLLAGIVLVSPVTCVDDIIAPGAAKPATLIGRALKPFLEADRPADEAVVEKARAVFLRMFAAGAKNQEALSMLMSAREAEQLHQAIRRTIHGVTWRGGLERVQALASMQAPTRYFSPEFLPLAAAPALVLFAEREEGVLDPRAPTRFAFERAHRAYFPQSAIECVTARTADTPVQHASLIFHVFDFLPPLHAFYQRLRRGTYAALAA